MYRFLKLMEVAGVKDFQINDEYEESTEMFFIKKRLDMRRMKDVEKISISVFKDMEEDGKKLRGRADIVGNPFMSDEEWLSKIKSAAFSAGFVKNPAFSLPAGHTSEKVVVESDLSTMKLSDIADKFVEAVYEEDKDEKSFINSLEVFAKKRIVRIVDSEGSDVSYEKTTFDGEFVVQCKEPLDVETHQSFKYDTLNLDDIKSLVKRTIVMTKDRAIANVTPESGNYDVVISHKYMPELFKLYLERANAAYIYAGYFENKVGEKIQGDDVIGDVLNIDFKADVPFDDDAIAKIDRKFIVDGELKTLHGAVRFSEYLGIEKIGTYNKIAVKEGNMALADMLNRPCIHVVNFSDFQMDPFDGHFKGEIRLGYMYDGKGNVTPVTGGSINGSFLEAQKNITFSKEVEKLYSYEGPIAVLIKDVPIAGK